MTTLMTPRRSSRQRKSSTKYDDQVEWTEDTIRLLRAESDSPDRSSESSALGSAHNRNDDDFSNMTMPGVDEVLLGTTASSESLDSTESLAEATPDPDPDPFEPEIERDTVEKRTNWRPRAYHRPKTREWAKEKGLRSRMLQEGAVAEKLRGAKNKVYIENYGPELEDLYPVLRSRDVWHLKARDVVLPSRASIMEAMQLDAQGKYLPFTSTDRENKTQSKSLRDQVELSPDIVDKGRATNQVVDPVTIAEAAMKSYVENNVRNETVLGPWNSSRKFNVDLLNPICISDAFSAKDPRLETVHNERGLQDQQVQPSTEVSNNSKWSHRGWLVNLGARPQCFAWAYCESDTQYLAITFKSTHAQRGYDSSRTSKLAPAFSPSSPHPSHVQILKISAASGRLDHPAQLSFDRSSAPNLHQLLCTSFGNLLRIEWLPLPPTSPKFSDKRSLVLLCSDGNVRVLTTDLHIPSTYEVRSSDLIARPVSHTVYTCFCLPSHEDLITGDAAGAVHLFNLNESASNGELKPYATLQIHHTYIMSLAVATDHPHFLCSSSAGGEMILTDLRNPHHDQVKVHKSRLPTRNLAYFPFTRCFLTTTDAAGNSESTGTSLSTVVGHNFRHFYTTSTILKLPECSGITTVLATSTFHPTVLVANAAGGVFVSNVIRRLMPIGWKGKGEGAATYMMKLYEVDWTELQCHEDTNRQTETEMQHFTKGCFEQMDVDINEEQIREQHLGSNQDVPSHSFVTVQNTTPKPHTTETLLPSGNPTDLYHGPPSRSGVTRFHEGFRPERAELGNFGYLKAKSKPVATKASSQIILPEEQAVTAMAWNPNGRFSGWCAIGWGSGLIVIRDLAHDTVQ